MCGSLLDIQTIHNVPTLGGCLRSCDALRTRYRHVLGGAPQYALKVRNRCMIAEYNRQNQSCVLKRRCRDRGSIILGPCLPHHRYCMYARGSMSAPRMRLGNYTRVGIPGRCGRAMYNIMSLENVSLRSCFLHCDDLHEKHHRARRYQLRMRQCETVQYEEESRRCTLKRQCEERMGLAVGLCHPQAKRCLFTRGETTRISAERLEGNRSRERRAAALLLARKKIVDLNGTGSGNACAKAHLTGEPG